MTGITTKQIYEELTNAGASTIQAIGIMANMMNESSLDPEAAAMDSNGYYSYGLVQWNAASYPNAASLVTGNAEVDLKNQVQFLKQSGAFSDANGSTIAEAAGNFASSFERCQGCQQGGAQYEQRVNNAGIIQGWVNSGKWPVSGGSGGTSGSGNATLTGFEGDPMLWTNVLGGVQGILQFPGQWLGNKISNQGSNPLNSLYDISKDVNTATHDFAQFMKWLSWLFAPSSWLRIGAFFFGLLCFGASLYMFKEAL